MGKKGGKDVTVEILIDIRNEIRGTNARLESVEGRLESMDTRLGRVEKQLELNTQGLNDLGKFMRDIALDQARHERFHAQHVEVVEKDVADLKDRVRKLEGR